MDVKKLDKGELTGHISAPSLKVQRIVNTSSDLWTLLKEGVSRPLYFSISDDVQDAAGAAASPQQPAQHPYCWQWHSPPLAQRKAQ